VLALAELFFSVLSALIPPCYNKCRMKSCKNKLALLSALPFLGLLTPEGTKCQNPPERSHQERFAPAAQSMEKAESELTAKLEANPKDAALLSSRGLLRLQLSKQSDALADLQEATQVAPTNAQFEINLAYGLLMNLKFKESVAEAQKAVALEDRSYAAHGLLGRALLASGGPAKEAIEQLQRSLELYPNQTDLRFELVNALRQEKDFPVAGVQLRILKDQLPPGDARLEYAQGMLSADLGYPQAAVASFRRALELNPGSQVVRQDLGAALIRTGKWSEAAEVLGPLAASQPNSYQVAYLNALALQNSQHSKEAEVEARRALALDANSADAHTLLGLTLSSQSRFDEAITELTRAVEIAPDSFDAEFYLGRTRYARSDTAGAAAALQKAVSLRPEDPEARFLLGTILEVSGEREGAIRQYKELQRISPNDARGYLGLGGILGKGGELEEALVQLRKARALDPSSFEANMDLGRTLAKAGKVEESIEFLREAAKKSPDSPEVHYQLALSLQRAGRRAEAAKEFAEVDRLNRQRRGESGMGIGNPKP
jgi:tetratricopeptide (TPR) repeat protein